MSIGSSIIRVDIIGDASKLTAATAKAETSVSGMLKGIGGAIIAAGVADALFDIGKQAIELNDTMQDNFANIRRIVTDPVLEDAVIGLADDFERISKSDTSTLLSQIANLSAAQGLQLTAEQFADIVASADALSMLNPDLSTADAIAAIMKATNNPEGLKALNKLGIFISDADLAAQGWSASADDGANAAATLRAILVKLDPAVDEVAKSLGDAEDAQRRVNKRWEDFLTEIGPQLDDLWARLGEAVIVTFDALGALSRAVDRLWTAFKNLAKGVIEEIGRMAEKLKRWFTVDIPNWVGGAVRSLNNFLDLIADAIRELRRMIGLEQQSGGSGGGFGGTSSSTSRSTASAGGGGLPAGVTINISGDPVTIERTVVRALRTYSRRNGGLAGLG